MSQQQKQTELLNEQLNVENSDTNKETSSNQNWYEKQYHNTGIYIRGNREQGYFITAGQYKLEAGYETPGEAEEALKHRHYEIIMGLITAMIHFEKQQPSEFIQK